MEGLESSKLTLTAKLPNGGSLGGALSTKGASKGTLSASRNFSGELKARARICGVLSTKGHLWGRLSGVVRYVEVPGEGGELYSLEVTSGTQDYTFTPPEGYYGFGEVTVKGDEDLVPENIRAGKNILGVDGAFKGGELQEVTVRSTFDRFGVEPDEGYYGISKVIVDTDPNLAARNIRKGVKMFDVEGTYGNFTSKSATITKNGSYNYTPDSYDGLSEVKVTVNVPSETIENVVDANLTDLYVSPGRNDQTFNKRAATGEGEIHGYNYVKVYGDDDLISDNIRKGATIFGVAGSYEKTEVVEGEFQEKTLVPSSFPYYVRPDSGYDALTKVTLNADSDLKSGNIKSGVNIFGVVGDYTGEEAKMQAKTVTPESFPSYVYPDSSYDGLSEVKITADPNLVPSNIANGKKIFGVTGTYESKMQAGTAISGASDYKLALTEPGALGFNEVFVKGDANLVGKNIKAGVTILNVEGTYEGDGSYEDGYKDGYDDGYAAGAASGGGGSGADTTPYLYGTPDEEGKVALADGDGYVLYKGGLFPNYAWNKEKYPYVVVIKSILFDSFEYWPTKPEVRNTSNGAVVLLPETEPTKVVRFEKVWGAAEWSGPYETELGMTYNIARVPQWSNTKLYRDSGELYIAGTPPIRLVSNKPVAALYNGVELPPLPEYDKETYPYSCVKMVINAYGEHVFTHYACPNPINRQGDYYYAGGRPLTCQCRPDSEEDSARVWSDLKEGFALTVKADELMWTSHDISYTEEYGGGLARSADPAPIPVYETKE